MGKISFKLENRAVIEKYEEGIMISFEDSDQIVCLGMYEYELLELILAHDMDEVMRILSEKYQGSDMQTDLEEYCEKLCACHVLHKCEL